MTTRNQIPLHFPWSYTSDGKVTSLSQQAAFYLQELTENLPPSGAGYVLDGSLSTYGHEMILFQGPAADRGVSPAVGSIYFALDTGETYVAVGGSWLEYSPALVGDVTKPAHSNVTTLATVNPDVGTFGSSTQIPILSLDAKGRVIGATSIGITTPTPGASGPNQAIQFNNLGSLAGTASLQWSNLLQAILFPNAYVSGTMSFTTPLPTFNNLSPLTLYAQ